MTIKKPFFIVNPKSYLYGDDVLRLAKISDKIAKKYDIDCIFTGQLIDLPMIIQNTSNLIVTAQFMDSITPGRGMGYVLPDALKYHGVQAVVLNHAEKVLTLSEIDKTIARAKDIGLKTIVCADTVAQAKAIAQLHPTMMICEPTSLIGTGTISNDDYVLSTNKAIREVDSDILIMQAAGVSTAQDVVKVLDLGADGTGGTSGIINAPDWEEKIEEMISVMAKYKKETVK